MAMGVGTGGAGSGAVAASAGAGTSGVVGGAGVNGIAGVKSVRGAGNATLCGDKSIGVAALGAVGAPTPPRTGPSAAVCVVPARGVLLAVCADGSASITSERPKLVWPALLIPAGVPLKAASALGADVLGTADF